MLKWERQKQKQKKLAITLTTKTQLFIVLRGQWPKFTNTLCLDVPLVTGKV